MSPAPTPAARLPLWSLVLASILAVAGTEEPCAADGPDMELAEQADAEGFEAAHRRLLQRLEHEGSRSLAVSAADLVIATFGDQPERLGRLGRDELAVAAELAHRDPEALVPLLLLHHDLVLEYRRRGRPYLTLHGIRTLRELVDGYVRAAGTAGARVVASRIVASLGGHLQEAGRSSCLELFEQALGYHPGNAAALLGLAAYLEKHGGPYEDAVGLLERLHQLHPEHREGRLRLAINLLRVEREVEATAHLEALVAAAVPDWITSLATQELLRHWAARGRLAAAIDVARAGIELQPDDQKLHVLLVYLLDRHRSSDASGRQAQRLAAVEPAPRPARARYNQWPRETLETARAELQSWARSRLPAFAESLGTEPAGAVRADTGEETP